MMLTFLYNNLILIDILTTCSQDRSQLINILSKQGVETAMRGNPQKVFKFIRKQYQASEEVNPKREHNRNNPEKDGRSCKPMSVEEERLRRNLNYFNYDQPVIDKNQKYQTVLSPKTKPLVQQERKDDGKKQKDEDINIQFDKNLSKVIVPDQLQKIKLVRKIENRLLSCLDKKKPQVSVKQLINQQALIDILGKRQRKVLTKNGNYQEKLDVEADSTRKQQNHTKHKHNHIKKQKQHRQKQNRQKHTGQVADSSTDVLDLFQEEAIYQMPGKRQFELDFKSDSLFDNERSFFDLELQKYRQEAYSIPQNDDKYTNTNMFASQSKPFLQQRPSDKNRYDLRNLKIPKLDKGEIKQNWKKPSVEPIQQVSQDEKLNFYFSSDNSDQHSLFPNEKYPLVGSEKKDSQWHSQSQFY